MLGKCLLTCRTGAQRADLTNESLWRELIQSPFFFSQTSEIEIVMSHI